MSYESKLVPVRRGLSPQEMFQQVIRPLMDQGWLYCGPIPNHPDSLVFGRARTDAAGDGPVEATASARRLKMLDHKAHERAELECRRSPDDAAALAERVMEGMPSHVVAQIQCLAEQAVPALEDEVLRQRLYRRELTVMVLRRHYAETA